MIRKVKSSAAIALLDQMVVSGSRFLTVILIGRLGGTEMLGAFALPTQALILIAIAQESLVSAPYTIFSNRYEGRDRTDYAGSVLLHAGLQTVILVAALALCSALAMATFGQSGFSAIAWVVTAIAPLILLREFGRRFVFADLRMNVAVAMDIAMAFIQISGLALLAMTDSLTVSAALWVTGIASGVPGICWLIHDRHRFTFQRSEFLTHWKRNWGSGRWLFSSQFIVAATGASLYPILALAGGLAATGVFTACMAIVQLANPLLLGLGNWLEPLTAKAYAMGGFVRLKRIVQSGQAVLFAGASAFCVLAYLFGADLIAFIYSNAEFADHRSAIFVLSLSVLANAVGLPPQMGLRAIEKARHVFSANLIESLVMVLAVTILGLIARVDVLAAAYALAIGPLAATIIMSLAFLRQTPRPEAHSSLALNTERGVPL